MNSDISASELSIEAFDYPLPESSIAFEPNPDRESSRLLVYREGSLVESRYSDIADYLDDQDYAVFNNSRVVQARLQFEPAGGKKIEIFCLEPADKTLDQTLALQREGEVLWRCFVGNAKKWKGSTLSRKVDAEGRTFTLSAELTGREGDVCLVRLFWDDERLVFADVLEAAGKIPLPPYIEREATESDKLTYQTIYARDHGSVAAPTAGLHFTERIFTRLKARGISYDYLTLHVGAGTFKPVKADKVGEHVMHDEQLLLDRAFLSRLLEAARRGKNIVAVGTTSARFLESVYWIGCKLIASSELEPSLGQWEAYRARPWPVEDALKRLLDYMEAGGLSRLQARTSIMIMPGYDWKIVDKLVTNFHQPKSTLVMLVASFIGDDWREVYQYALNHHFRFLSYGDGCFLEKKKNA